MAWYDKEQLEQLGQMAKAIGEDVGGGRPECPICEGEVGRINRMVYRAAGCNYCPVCGSGLL